MKNITKLFCVAIPLVSCFFLIDKASSQIAAPVQTKPTLLPVAETKLIMQGITHANFLALGSILNKTPKDVQTWTFARGQALLIAESGNLLLLRPPQAVKAKNEWFQKAMELRDSSTRLARNLGTQNYQQSRQDYVRLANVCNRCHEQFQVRFTVEPFANN